MGLVFAFIALVGWGFGDFFIQRTTRVTGSERALFFITAVGMILIFPFVRKDLATLGALNLLLLALVGIVMLFAALFDFEALRQGKIAIIEPIMGIELPLTMALGITLGRDILNAPQIILIFVIFIGIVLAVTSHHKQLHYHKRILEKGVILAGVGAIGMALTNFLVGVSSQNISPLVTVWFAHSLIAIIMGVLIAAKGELPKLISDLRKHPGPIAGQSFLDNGAWVAFAFSTTYIPLSISTAITESYVALAALLGILLNREKLKKSQMVGVALALVGVIILSYFSS
ncbi:MAG: EamA family transporter [Patescibacteria group bacterium]